MRKGPYGLDMVCMVVGHQYRLDSGQWETVIAAIALEHTNANAQIDQYGISISTQVITIAATATSEADKLNHDWW